MTSAAVPTIRRLDETVVNRIAAGEIIHRPASALKELIENSLDAGSTQIQILVKDGGLKLLQIQDNGHGIREADLPIVCERFTTSKLSKFEDLNKIATYGFRGEALASISHIAHVTITTKTADSKCAFRATYSDGKLVPPRPGQSAAPKPCAGNNGTQITAEDLFYNVPTRRKAIRSPSEEYRLILDVVNRYAIHNASVSFVCRRHGNTSADVQTSQTATTIDNIRQIYGSSLATELIYVEHEDQALEFKMSAYISNPNYSEKRIAFLLFINHRLVESNNLKRMLDNVYSPLLPKGTHPFVYLSLELKPQNVDVNVHPTKREVHFLNEDRIAEAIADVLQEKLSTANESRTFLTQTLLPMAPPSIAAASSSAAATTEATEGNKEPRKVAAYNKVRTDSRTQTLDVFMRKPQMQTSAVASSSGTSVESTMASERRMRITVNLTSVLNLRKDVKSSEDPALTAILRKHTFVGFVDDVMALIQHERELYIVNYAVVSEELFYQITLNDFANFGRIKLSEAVPIYDCIKLALDIEEQLDGLPKNLRSKEEVAQAITDILIQKREMLEKYFTMDVSEDGRLCSIPMLLKDYVPTLDRLPLFLLRLGTEVNWETEFECFKSLTREIAIFYSASPPAEPPSAADKNVDLYKQEHDRYRWQVQHLIFPRLKTQFFATKSLSKAPDGGKYIIPIASLPELYKIFERC
ncbi:hypothetical protein VTP01DRAFT_7643 [Rhizomucor pusillus]|uniref:uncharacterized protein n=1 Tax=Rhizomucor pusillus TaxID=4840 RepID=UPI003743EAF8